MKRFSLSIFAKKIYIVIKYYYYRLTRMDKIQETDTMKCWLNTNMNPNKHKIDTKFWKLLSLNTVSLLYSWIYYIWLWSTAVKNTLKSKKETSKTKI